MVQYKCKHTQEEQEVVKAMKPKKMSNEMNPHGGSYGQVNDGTLNREAKTIGNIPIDPMAAKLGEGAKKMTEQKMSDSDTTKKKKGKAKKPNKNP